MDRRSFLAGALALASSRAWAAGASRMLGTIEVKSLSDGHLVLPRDFLFAGLPEAELQAILDSHGISGNEFQPPCNVTLMRDGPRNVLFDAGSGSGFMPTAGTLGDSLSDAGVDPEEITHVVFTHAHPDHLWGVLDDFDDPVFPNAEYLIGQAEWDYWLDPATVDTIGAARTAFAVGAARRLEAIAERCRFIADGEEVLPGVMAHGTFGHTPGHMSYEIRSGSDALLVVGDAIANQHVAFARPDWPSGSDQDADMGAATRARLLDMLAADGTPMLGFHLPQGGLGRVERKDGAYRFVPDPTL